MPDLWDMFDQLTGGGNPSPEPSPPDSGAPAWWDQWNRPGIMSAPGWVPPMAQKNNDLYSEWAKQQWASKLRTLGVFDWATVPPAWESGDPTRHEDYYRGYTLERRPIDTPSFMDQYNRGQGLGHPVNGIARSRYYVYTPSEFDQMTEYPEEKEWRKWSHDSSKGLL